MQRELSIPRGFARLPERPVANCTGKAARKLLGGNDFDSNDLRPGPGQSKATVQQLASLF